MNKSGNQLERRLHPRVPIRAYAQLHLNDEQWEVHLLDMSMSGAKLALLDSHTLACGANFNLHVSTEHEGVVSTSTPQTITLLARPNHMCEHSLGIEHIAVADDDKEAHVRLLAANELN